MPAPQPPSLRHASYYGRIGVARADITPPVGIFSRNWGAAKHDVASSIHRPLTLTALALAPQAGGQPLVLIDTDLVGWRTSQAFSNFHKRLVEAVSVEPENLIFAVSHTHSSPPLMDADDSLPGGELMRKWMQDLFESSVRSVRQAIDTQFVGTLDWHVGHCNLATSRDLPEPDAVRERVVCGYSPNGATDDTLLVGRITDATGQIRATLTNYACHPTTLAWDNTAISPDYVGAMRETIQQATGAPAMFLLGACGELAPRYQYLGDLSVADCHGKQLGYATLATLHDMTPAGTQLVFDQVVESGAPLAVWKHEACQPNQELRSTQTAVELPLKNWPTAGELEQQRQACQDRALEERLRRKRSVRLNVGDRSTFMLPIHTWRIGDAVLIGTCCEAYSVLQKELRRRFPQHKIVCLNLINGAVAYLPPAELYDSDVYPVWQTPFDRGCLEQTLDTMTEAIRDVLANG